MSDFPAIYWLWLVPLISLIALFAAFLLYRSAVKKDEGTERMREIASYVRTGAMAYLRRQYRIVAWVFLIITGLFALLAYGFGRLNPFAPFIFLSGGVCSALAGWLGMKTATMASARTANAARSSLNAGLQLAFRCGAVMGLTVVGLGLLFISLWYLLLLGRGQQSVDLSTITTTVLVFGMGASTMALFARVGGGIFTKSADVGADLVGKVEAGIPEDDPRNPAVIADNVGDNVGDVAGMGADLYESYAGSILAAAVLAIPAYSSFDMRLRALIVPMLIAAAGIVLSLLGIFLVRSSEKASQRDLLRALDRGIYFSSFLMIIKGFAIPLFLELSNWVGIGVAVAVGLLVGLVIGKATEYSTSEHYRPTKLIANSASSDTASLIICGIGNGMLSVAWPVLAVGCAIILAFGASSGWQFNGDGIVQGLYGIAVAAVGMLSTLGITLATDAYGPIADNAGGNAEMSGLEPEVRERTDALDSLGNTTAAIGKGFAIGSAGLTALALLASYLESVRSAALVSGTSQMVVEGRTIDLASAGFVDLMNAFQINLINPLVLIGLFIGTVMSFVFCGMTMNAVGRAATAMVDEVRRQFREIKGIMESTAKPDYAKCVDIATKGALKEMMLPAILALLVPVLTGVLLGVAGVVGLLVGSLLSCFTLAIFMANTGGSWDNAKKYIEGGNFGGKGSPAHKSAVIGDTVGDPFKDTSGPSLNILLKLMSMVAIVSASITVSLSIF